MLLERELDFIIFGASGFTGKYTVLEAVVILNRLRWGVAGRDENKLKKVLTEASTKTGQDLSSIAIIIANVDDNESLKRMTSKCKVSSTNVDLFSVLKDYYSFVKTFHVCISIQKVIINCVGPFHLYGEPVVKACIETATHQIDISGDPMYILNIMLKYNDKARESGSLIIPACGVDSIPGDIGVLYLESQFNGTVAEVEEFLEASGRPKKGASIHFGSYASIVHACASKKETDQLREKLFSDKNSKLKSRGLLHKSKVTGTWCTPFFGVDKDLIRKSQMHLYFSNY